MRHVRVRGGGQQGRSRRARLVADGLVVETMTEALKEQRKARLNQYLSNHNAYCTPPCQQACPAGIDIAGYIRLIAEKKYVEATALIKLMLPLPGILGRVCPRPARTRAGASRSTASRSPFAR